MDNKERQSAEFKALQDEMLENSRKVYQVLTSTIALCAGLIGYCFTPDRFPNIIWGRPFALLSPFLILIPAIILIQSSLHSTVRIAAFLKVVFEDYRDKELPGWQTAMQWCREVKGPTQVDTREEPARPAGRHFLSGLRGILLGIAIVATLASLVAGFWLLYHDQIGRRPHFVPMLICYLLCLGAAWALFLVAYSDMRAAWDKTRFAEWQGHWRGWVEMELLKKLPCEARQSRHRLPPRRRSGG